MATTLFVRSRRGMLLTTEGETLLRLSKAAALFEIKKVSKKSFMQKLGKTAYKTYDAVLSKVWQEKQENTYL